MKIATYNVNSVNARLPVLLRWLAESRPDVACLQELKAPQGGSPPTRSGTPATARSGTGRRRGTGVAILARAREPAETGRGLAGDPDDAQSRYLEGAVGGVRVGCLYLPNGNPAPGPKFDYKLRWLERFAARAAELVALPEPVVLAGDYNVIPEEIDVYNPSGWAADALFRPESRGAYRRLLAQGWTDALRHRNSDGRVFTFWGLHPRGAEAKRRAADRPPAAQPSGRGPADGCGRGSRCPGEDERSRAGVDRIARGVSGGRRRGRRGCRGCDRVCRAGRERAADRDRPRSRMAVPEKSDMWNERYSQPDFAYGSEPNEFLMTAAARIPIGPVLSLGEGEGRNAAFLAGLGHGVVAVDQSEVGLAKAQRLAADRDLTIGTVCADLDGYRIEPGAWAGIVSIFCHLPRRVRVPLYAAAVRGLRPGGVLVLEAYAPDQIGRGTGGPRDPDMLAALAELIAELDGLEFLHARELERDVREGAYHSGVASVVQVIGVSQHRGSEASS